VIGPLKPDHLEGKGFGPKVARCLEGNREVDSPKRGRPLSWYVPMEGAPVG
jgi:hypothetical protein